jgi:6-phosphogluconolactonase
MQYRNGPLCSSPYRFIASSYLLFWQPPYKAKIDWQNVFVFWGDERWVPLDDAHNNAKMAYDCLLSHVDIPKKTYINV